MQTLKLGRWCRCVLATGLLVTTTYSWATDRWNIIQDVNLNANASLRQGNAVTNTNTIQALNVIKLASGQIWVTPRSRGQVVTLNNNTLSLNQHNSGNGNVQAANVVDINGGLDTLPRQDVTGFAHASLQQTSTGTDNVQALNVAIIDNATELDQRVYGTTVTMNNLGIGAANNTQALNYHFMQQSAFKVFTIRQVIDITTLNIHTDSGFNSTGRYGQGVNIVIYPSAMPPVQHMIQQTANIAVLNVNGSGAAKVSAVLNRKIAH